MHMEITIETDVITVVNGQSPKDTTSRALDILHSCSNVWVGLGHGLA